MALLVRDESQRRSRSEGRGSSGRWIPCEQPTEGVGVEGPVQPTGPSFLLRVSRFRSRGRRAEVGDWLALQFPARADQAVASIGEIPHPT